ncbi:hypothetical protein LFL96_21225 [Paraburkholderia sp. D15]|uniref:hypothetical protein n=1 Tax=Paraburkholderia sp. D15 TaxID=2880218 RepID=UPI002479D76B|nr:hypothetical protein [Paraburkholderia sp. D15]WGS53582.1 hypothetical protein LFL96_21225 [Paraburkholderia sp. D15]
MTDLNVTQSSGDQAAPEGKPTINGNTLVVSVKDGRKLTLTYPGPLAQYKLVRAMGPVESENARLCRMYMPLIYLSAIDETPVLLPTSMLQLDALVERLGHKGLAALQDGVQVFDASDETEEAKK